MQHGKKATKAPLAEETEWPCALIHGESSIVILGYIFPVRAVCLSSINPVSDKIYFLKG